ncbi:MAG: ribonuclease HII [Clostridium sp.]|nr:ribonuclease HII [Clostridium sp.]
MIKVTIFNINGFLQTVNDCSGAVNLLQPDGRREDINKQYWAQSRLTRRFQEQNGYLSLALDIPTPKDYFKIVNYAIGS